ncbi:MAG: alpha/beta hydrolase [Betaproteobacteria bacterium]|jgi:pimeloyl-ACP methyl ester carboxylesterase|nr:alpha/beta hydrolase [Betaproteobacteria bacterium]MBP6317638.1 alpha/beta hydrolase [Rubrivivax sp.]MBK7517220.1 alpha/beta hydrolase [Betaproteobacteria bacterium]MBK8106925.1 alpha/beta hydrolase [Betaproteobacteria bacterium]MBK8864121.1 alpha/beta hydrolase [Betaproteobacteria bacterium]
MAVLLRIFGALLLVTALALALSRAPDRPVETLVARWALPPSDFIEVRGQVVHLRDEGPRDDPLPLVLIHGTSASLHTWEGWVAALKGQRRIISFDLPGFGLTGPFTGQYSPGDYRGDTYARFVLDLLDALQVPRAVVGGNSLGGEIAWRLAVMAPERVAALVLVDAAGPVFTPESVPLGFAVARLPVVNRIAEWVLPRSVVAQSLTSVYGDPARVTPELVDRHFELTLREGNRRALGQRMQQWVMGEGAEQIARVKQPTLILWGGRDRLIPPAVGQWLQQQIAGSRLVVFDDLGHVPHEENPARTVAPVKDFLLALK